MKKIFLTLIMQLLLSNSYGQSYVFLADDPMGDITQPFAPDIDSLSFRMDLAHDSIWFYVKTYNPVDPNGDVGLMFGLDTNLVTTDGIVWNGNNLSMKYDQAFVVFQDFISPNYYGFLYSNSGSSQIPTTVLRPDSFTFIISTQLSLLDQDGNLNLLFGSGAFDILSTRDVFEDVPNAGYMTIMGITGIAEKQELIPALHVYPNPATQYVHVGMSKSRRYEVFSFTGTAVLKGEWTGEKNVDLHTLTAGFYLLKVFCEDEKNQSSVFLKIDE